MTDDIEDIPSSPNRRSAHRPGGLPSPPSTTLQRKRKKIRLKLHIPLAFFKKLRKSERMESTRIFVSGLPPTLSSGELGKHFSSRFQVTDAHVFPKRRIGFVGFKNASTAEQAVNYFNKTYIRMSKISVEIARLVCMPI